MLKVSIIVPVYNVEQYLENCIESILNQTFKDYELILVDDGATDKSGEICDKYERKDSRIRVIHKSNGGLSSARNAGLDVACGKYIGFVDSDDSIHPKMYEILYDLAQKYKSDISCCNYKHTYSLVNEEREEMKLTEIIEMDNIQAVNTLYDKDIGVRLVVAWNKLYSRDLFEDLRYEVGRIHEDEFIAHKLLYKSNKTVYINSELYYYLQREGSIMSQISYKRKVDSLLAQSDRMKFFEKVGLNDICYRTSMMYEYKFFEVYEKIKNEYGERGLYLKELKMDFISNLKILFKLKEICIKEKLLWITFIFTPSIYEIYQKSK